MTRHNDIPQWLIDLPNKYSIILFDGICAVCNTFVNFVMDHDTDKQYKFASLQSTVGQQLLHLHAIDPKIDSMVLINSRTDTNKLGIYHTRSSAAILIITSIYWWFNVFIYVPLLLRDWCYARFASIRYKLFGYVDRCRLPTNETKQRFIEYSTLADEGG